MDCSLELARVATGLSEFQDIIEGRLDGPNPPQWAVRRGWVDVLLRLDDDELHEIELNGGKGLTGLSATFAGLAELLNAVETAVEPVADSSATGPSVDTRSVMSARKAAQVAALARFAMEQIPPPTRVVDLGSGHGHVTRVFGEIFSCPYLGIDISAERVATARALGGSFRQLDALSSSLLLAPGDLLIGLHACGALGDRLVTLATENSVPVCFLGCCAQKIPTDCRSPLSSCGKKTLPHIPKEFLGLANLALVKQGVESSFVDNQRGRIHRYALRLLLRALGQTLKPGDEMRGLGRRWGQKPFIDLATRALVLRGLSAPQTELDRAESAAHTHYPVMRRLALPRLALGPVLEVAIALDRATWLEEQGYQARVERIFPAAVSPRNLAISGIVNT